MTPAIATAALRPSTDLRGPARIGLLGLLLLIGILGTWAATTVIAGAVIAQGHALVEGKTKQVQSLDGGIVAEIAVQNGDRVSQGQVLLRLDATMLMINLDIARGRLAGALTLKARLEAEQLGLPAPVFDYPDLPFPPLDTTYQEEGQLQIFAARAEVRVGQRARLAETLDQYKAQIAGTEAQMVARRHQLAYLETDLANVGGLVTSGLARQSQLTGLQRDEAELQGQIAGLDADLAGLRIAMRDAELETLQRERGFIETVVTELRDVTAQTEELILEIATLTAQLDRIAIRAPADGVVHELQVTTIGGVVAPGATILEVVPLGRGMEFELRVDPRAIDQVYPGQPAQLVITSLDPKSTPRLTGKVVTISPGTIRDPSTGQSFYRIGLSVDPSELARLGEIPLMPGMPLEAYLETGDRTVLAYLLQPLSSHLRRALRE